MRVFGRLIVVALLFVFVSFKAFGSLFPDVKSTDWFYPYVKAIYDAGITKGYPDGTYRPFNLVTRAQMAAFIARAIKANVPSDCDKPPFPDVRENSWYCKYVLAIKNKGIATGYPDGTYRPNNYITRAQMAVFIARALHLQIHPCDTKPFNDVSTGSWYCPYVKSLVDRGIVEGYPDGSYKPQEAVTRAMMAVYIAKAFLGVGGTNGDNDNSSDNGGNPSGNGDNGQIYHAQVSRKVSLADLRLNSGYGLCTQDSFYWSKTIVVSRDGKYVKFPNVLGLTYFDEYNNTVYEAYYDNSDNFIADKVDFNSNQPAVTEFSWLENTMSPIVKEALRYAFYTTYIKNHILLAYGDVQGATVGDNDNTVKVYDFDIVNQNTNDFTFNNYTFPQGMRTFGVDNGSQLAIMGLQNSDKDRTFVYINPNQVSLENTDINTGYFTTSYQPSDFVSYYPPVIVGGNLYIAGFYDSNNASVLNIEDSITGDVKKSITVKDVFDTEGSDNNSSFIGFTWPMASQNGKYIFTPIWVSVPNPDNSSEQLTFYFIDKIDTSTNDTVDVYPIYMIKGWWLYGYAVSPDGKYVYAITSSGSNDQNFVELVVLNTENGEERAYKLYINTSINEEISFFNLSYISTRMSTTIDGSFLYIPFVTYGTNSSLYITEIPTAMLNESVQ